MSQNRFRRVPLPRSLRWQFMLALAALELLIVAGRLTAVYALRVSAQATRQLAEERLVRMQQGQDLLQRTLLIEREAERMLATDSLEQMRARYDNIIKEMETLDRLVEDLGTASADVSVLTLQESAQLFRNTANTVAGLREATLRGDGTQEGRSQVPAEETVRRLYDQLQHEAMQMVGAAQQLSERFTADYRGAVRRLAERSCRNQRWVLTWFFGSLLLAWVVSRYFLGRHVLHRLQQVSHYLRSGQPALGPARVPVHGRDEIGQMARAVEQFLDDRQRLAEANQELETFSYSVSHDLRAPLRAIEGFARILLDKFPTQLGDQGRAGLENIHRNVLRMSKLIEDILDFSRMSRRELAAGTVDMSALTKEVFADVRAAAPKRNIVLRLGDLPPATGDSALIRQVLVNLLSNAVKFTAPREEAVIEVGCTQTGAHNTYRVKDNGVGFAMQDADKLFGVFQRLSGAERFEGTGIGLAIVKQVVLRHGGRVWAQSQPGEGATIFFTLPRA